LRRIANPPGCRGESRGAPSRVLDRTISDCRRFRFRGNARFVPLRFRNRLGVAAKRRGEEEEEEEERDGKRRRQSGEALRKEQQWHGRGRGSTGRRKGKRKSVFEVAAAAR